MHIDEKGHKDKGNGNEKDFQIDENKIKAAEVIKLNFLK